MNTHLPLPSPSSQCLLQTTASSFKDTQDRTIILRGTNLSGSSKLPYRRASHQLYHFFEEGESGDVTYVGRPFLLWDPNLGSGYPDEEEEEEDKDDNSEERKRRWYTSKWEDSADCHLARLKGWGFNLLRYVVTWEALEHDGPGKYDYEFIDFTIAILRKCREYGFRVYMDPHQDVWSRFSGGSGAPYWTLIACGLNPRNFTQTGTAILHSEYTPNSTNQDPDPSQLPSMLWSTGYNRLAAQTVFTLFFGGKTYAPKCIIDGVNIQDYLQSHYIEAFGVLADKIREADVGEARLLDECVIGWDSLNEPYAGFCGLERLEWNTTTAHGASLKKGPQPSVMQSLCLGMGIKQSNIENWEFGSFGPKKVGEIEIDPNGVKMWITREEAGETGDDGVSVRWGWKRSNGWGLGTCVWALHGVWSFSDGTPRILNPTYFSSPTPPSSSAFLINFWLPHFEAYAKRIRSSHPLAILFVQPPVFDQPPPIDESTLQNRACLSTHYYDGLTLVTRHWNWFNADALGVIRGKYRWTWQAVKFGTRAIRASLQEQLGILKSDACLISSSRAYPTVIGEIGTPMDMDHKRSYGLPYADPKDGDRYKGDYESQITALDASLNALDGDNVLSAAVWCYSPGNGHRWGDEWNMEDLSLWSRDDALEEGAMSNTTKKAELDADADADVDISSSRANLLFDKNRALPTISAPSMSVEIFKPDGFTTTNTTLYPPQQHQQQSRMYLHVDTDASTRTGMTSVATSTAASPTAASSVMNTPIHSPSSITPPPLLTLNSNPNPFATAANNTTTSLPLSSAHTQFSEFKMMPFSLPHPNGNNNNMSESTDQMKTMIKAETQTRATQTAAYLTFLISGARAVKAFSRPYPIATVGRPVNVIFDVESAVFKMGVWVKVAENGDGGEGEGVAVPPTEIFIPLVHYASEAGLKIMQKGKRTSVQMLPPAPQPASPYLHSHSRIMDEDDDVTVPPTPQSTQPTSPSALASTTTLANIVTKPASATTNSSTQRPSLFDFTTSQNQDLDMDLIVEVSHGRTVLEGQILRWYYDLPKSGSKEDEDGVALYEISVRRGRRVFNGVCEEAQTIEEEDEDDKTCPEMCWEALERCWKGLVGS